MSVMAIFHQLSVSLFADITLMSRESKEACVSYWSRRERLELADSGMGVEVYLLFFAEVASDYAQGESAEGCPVLIDHPVLDQIAYNHETSATLQMQGVRRFVHRAKY